jgi:hypothetical protein
MSFDKNVSFKKDVYLSEKPNGRTKDANVVKISKMKPKMKNILNSKHNKSRENNQEFD